MGAKCYWLGANEEDGASDEVTAEEVDLLVRR